MGHSSGLGKLPMRIVEPQLALTWFVDPGISSSRAAWRCGRRILGHIDTGFGFDRFGEFGAWLAQDRFYRGLARLALGNELHGEHSVRWTTGQLVDHKANLLDPRIQARARRGIAQQPD